MPEPLSSQSDHDVSDLPNGTAEPAVGAPEVSPAKGSGDPISVREMLLSEMQAIANEHGRNLGPLVDDTPLIDTGLDSLCLAVLVTRLEDRLGADPFSSPDDAGFPLTVGDFIRLYEHAKP